MSTETTISQMATLKAALGNEKVIAALGRVLPPGAMKPERLVAMFFVAAQRTPELESVTPASAISALMQAATDGLNPSGGPNAEAYLIPRWITRRVGDREVKTYEACYQRGYRGLLRLVRRSKLIEDIDAAVVYESDTFDIAYGPSAFVTHKPTLRGAPGAVQGAYCWWRVIGSGALHVVYYSVAQVEKLRQRSQVPNSPAWRNDYAAMARKTVVRGSWSMLPWDDTDAAFVAADVDDVIDLGEAEVKVPDALPAPAATVAVNAPLDAMVAGVPEAAPAAPAKRTRRAKATPEPQVIAEPTAPTAPEQVTMEPPPPTSTQPAPSRERSGFKIVAGPARGKAIEDATDDQLVSYTQMLRNIGDGDSAEVIACENEIEARIKSVGSAKPN